MTINTLRQCALRLHALGAEDREWILAQLTDDLRNSLEPLLEELERLGFCVDQSVLASMPELENASTVLTGKDEYIQNIKALNGASPEWIVATLKDEPRAIRHALEAVHAWAWEGEARAKWESDDTFPMRESLHSIGSTERTRQALVAAMVRKLPNELERSVDSAGGRNSKQGITNHSQSRLERGIARWLPWMR